MTARDEGGEAPCFAHLLDLMHEPDGKPTGIAAVLRDDTDRWRERRRVRAELAALQGEKEAVPTSPPPITP